MVATRELLAEPDVCARVTRWFAGQTLQSVLERVGRESFPLYLHLRVSCEVLSALQYLHELPDPSAGRAASCPAVRRQERVLITYTGQVKLLGVGFERTFLEIERRSGRRIAELATAAPEICLGYPAAAGADRAGPAPHRRSRAVLRVSHRRSLCMHPRVRRAGAEASRRCAWRPTCSGPSWW